MKPLGMVCSTLVAFATCVGCGGRTSTNVPNMNGTWSMVFTGAAASQGASPAPGTTLTATLNQTGSMLSGDVIGFNSPQASCLSGIANSQTRFTISGNVTNPIEAGSNLQLTLNFVNGATHESLQAKAATSEAAANGLFSISPGGICTGGNFAMTKVLP